MRYSPLGSPFCRLSRLLLLGLLGACRQTVPQESGTAAWGRIGGMSQPRPQNEVIRPVASESRPPSTLKSAPLTKSSATEMRPGGPATASAQGTPSLLRKVADKIVPRSEGWKRYDELISKIEKVEVKDSDFFSVLPEYKVTNPEIEAQAQKVFDSLPLHERAKIVTFDFAKMGLGLLAMTGGMFGASLGAVSMFATNPLGSALGVPVSPSLAAGFPGLASSLASAGLGVVGGGVAGAVGGAAAPLVVPFFVLHDALKKAGLLPGSAGYPRLPKAQRQVASAVARHHSFMSTPLSRVGIPGVSPGAQVTTQQINAWLAGF